MSVQMSISTISLKGLYEAKRESHDPVEMVVFSFFNEGHQTHLIVCDILHMCFSRVNILRKRISDPLNIQAKDIIFHFTHTHTGPRDEHMDLEKMSLKLISTININKSKKVAAKMASITIDTEGTLNFNRRKEMPHGLGKFTVWAGCVEKENKMDGSRVAINRLKCWLGEDYEVEELNEPLFYDDERDTSLQVVIFNDMDDNCIGSLTRFCAHPAVAGHTLDRRDSSDYPGYVRRILKSKWGGDHGYLTGPCGNICSWEIADWLPLKVVDHVASMVPIGKMKGNDDSFAESQRIAEALVQYIENNRPDISDFKELKTMKNQLIDFQMALREDLLADPKQAHELFIEIQKDLSKNRNSYSLADLKKQVDKANFYDFHEAFYERGYIDEKDHSNGFTTINIPSFQLNDLIFQGMPGESFWQSATPVRQWADTNNIKLVTFSFANGSTAYLPTDEERVFGDYEATFSISKNGAVKELSELILNSSRQLKEKNL